MGGDTGSAAPTVSQADAGKCKRVSSPVEVEDSEDKSFNSSSDKECEAAIATVPISSTPPLWEAKRSRVENYGISLS
jgi:hypothetical protein